LNTGGWIVLSLVFGSLLLLVQRAERKRRRLTFIILAFVGLIVWRYAIYRLSGDCIEAFALVCQASWIRQRALTIAINTVNMALLTSVIMNVVFWVLIGRSNPPGTSESIYVYGMDDEPSPASPTTPTTQG
jgi:hypothetical protein